MTPRKRRSRFGITYGPTEWIIAFCRRLRPEMVYAPMACTKAERRAASRPARLQRMRGAASGTNARAHEDVSGAARGVGVPDALLPLCDDVRADLRVQHRRARRERRFDVDEGGAWLVLDLDQIERVVRVIW